ncbi:MAG: hypothetical protein AAF411_07495 [Myxococcota bacterium]
MGTWRAGWLLVAGFALVGCSRHVRLVMPGTDGVAGTRYTCEEIGGRDERIHCTALVDVDPARTNAPGTTLIVLPEECGGMIHEVYIEDADSRSPRAIVQCAAPENTGPGIGVSP